MTQDEGAATATATHIRNVKDDPFYKKPRMLYGVMFVWIAITGGRFVTTFLEHECYLNASQIALLFAVQQFLGIPANTWAGRTADRLEGRYPGLGRAGTVAVGTTLGTICTLLHGTSRVVESDWWKDFTWFFILRVLYALSTSLVFPVLDGMCLQYLDGKQQDYGKERLWGAVTWAVTNVLLGPILDRIGFVVTYPLGVVTYLAVLASLFVYTNNDQSTPSFALRRSGRRRNDHSVVAIRKRDSELELTDVPSESSTDDAFGDDNAEMEDKEAARNPNRDHDIDAKEGDVPDQSSPSCAAASNATPTIPTQELVRQLLFGLSPWYYGCCFIVAVTMLASGQVIVDSLIFLFFEDLGSSYTVMGWTVVLTVLFEIPVFSVAGQLLDRFGSTALLLTAMLCYIMRVLGYTLIPAGHVVYALVVEPMHGITYACSQTAVVDFVAQSMPHGYEATGQALVYVMRGLGNVVGLLMGGVAEGTVGPRVLYRCAAAVVSTGAVILGTARYFQLRQQQQQHIAVRELVSSGGTYDDGANKTGSDRNGHPTTELQLS